MSSFPKVRDVRERSILRWVSCAAAILGVLAFWIGMLMAARRYPWEYDWRYMPASNLASSDDNPAGYLWASTGIVVCSICGLFWTAVLAQYRNRRDSGGRPGGIRSLQFGNICMMFAAALPKWLLTIKKGHGILAALAFTGLSVGMVCLTFKTIEQALLMRMHRLNRHALLYALIVACIVASPILLAGLAQAYFYYVPPDLHWISFSWRVRGWPVFLRFSFWEWVTCIVLSAYMTVSS